MDRDAEVVAVLRGSDDAHVVAGAAALARVLGAVSMPLRVGTPPGAVAPDAGHAPAAVLDALSHDEVVGGVLEAHGDDALLRDVVVRARVPLLVIPEAVRRPIGSLRRVLLPLDGSPATVAGARPLLRSCLDAGADVVAVHVFDSATTPGFWDQAAHAHRTWTREFLRRHDLPVDRLDLRSGRPVEEVLAAAEGAKADVVLLAWGQDLDAGRAQVVRRALRHGTVPLLLTRSGPGTNDRRDPGPSSLAPQPWCG